MNSSRDTSGSAKTASASATPEAILDALNRILSSEMFTGASRLGDLLEYILNQNLADPSRKILAKTIAEDIYGRPPDMDGDNHNIVRVDAGRLRRRLGEYYAGPGQDDPVVIHVDPGGYAPRFEINQAIPARAESEPTEKATAGHSTARAAGAAAIALCVGMAIGSFASFFENPNIRESLVIEDSGDQRLNAERRARMSKSPSSLQAVTLSDHARNLIFPMFERDQLALALAMFRQAIQKDKSYFGGYAGAAQCLSAMALLLPDSPERTSLLIESRQMIDRAVELSPTNSWTQSALSWTLFTEGHSIRAREHAEIALELAPDDGNVLDFFAMLMLLTGEFEAAREAADPNRERKSGLGRLANRSFYGAASFHLGLYEDAVGALTEATFSGDPISAPTLAYLAASYQGLGQTGKATQLAQELLKNWPKFDPDVVFSRLYLDPNQAREVSRKLIAAGWGSASATDLNRLQINRPIAPEQ